MPATLEHDHQRMKAIVCAKIAVDLVMALVFVLLLNQHVLGGLPFHEIAGSAISVMFLTHVLLSWNWVVQVSRRIFNRQLPAKTRLGYLLNVWLLLAMVFIMVSGILVSKILFPELHVANQRWFTGAHIGVSFLILLFVGIHLGLHWRWVISRVDRMFSGVPFLARSRFVSIIAVVALAGFGSYQVYRTHYLSKLGLLRNLAHWQKERPRFAGRSPAPDRREHLDGGRGGFPERGVEQRREDPPGLSLTTAGDVAVSYLGLMSIFALVTSGCDNWLSRRASWPGPSSTKEKLTGTT